LAFAIIGLIGVIKGNKYILITINVFAAIEVFVFIITLNFIAATVSFAITLLTGIYALMVTHNEVGYSAI
jgi:hypothetical protein